VGWQRFQQIDKLSTKEKWQLVQLIDTFLKATQVPELASNH
jgi:hypothetical protein